MNTDKTIFLICVYLWLRILSYLFCATWKWLNVAA